MSALTLVRSVTAVAVVAVVVVVVSVVVVSVVVVESVVDVDDDDVTASQPFNEMAATARTR